MTFVSRKASAPVIDRSTWLSAAKWITAVGLWWAKIASIFARSQISACRNAYRLSFAMGSSDRRFAAYVSLSTLTTDTFRVAASCRHTAEPMNPAPPVTNMFIEIYYSKWLERPLRAGRVLSFSDNIALLVSIGQWMPSFGSNQ